MRKYLGAVVVVALAGVAVAADVDGKKLTGKWESKGDKDTLVIEFKDKDKVRTKLQLREQLNSHLFVIHNYVRVSAGISAQQTKTW